MAEKDKTQMYGSNTLGAFHLFSTHFNKLLLVLKYIVELTCSVH